MPRCPPLPESFPRTSASSIAPAIISTSAHEPWASMWSVEFVKNTITGHKKIPSENAIAGHKYARHARSRQTSVPTTASAARHRPSSRKPVAKSQWTCSARGCMLLEILEQSAADHEVEEQADRDH